MNKILSLLATPVTVLTLGATALAYGPFNHLCAVDREWKDIYQQIQALGPLDESEAMDAVFAGAIADDLGYYHLGNPALKDLTSQAHYIRTGEWADFLLRRARTSPAPNAALDYAFALGVLSHYAVDRMGHYYGTNVVAVQLARKQLIFGPRMSYERDPGIHTKVEAGFDLLSLETSCRADQLSDRFYRFLEEPGWPQSEQVFGFVVNALREFYGYSPLDKVHDLTHAVIFARKYVLRLLQEEGGPYALKRVGSKQSAASSKPQFYAALTPAEIAEDDKWIDQQLQVGRSFRDVEKSSGLLPVFADSFSKAQALLSDVVKSAGDLRLLQDKEINSGTTLELDNRTFPNVNLDTNQFSISGRYDLADCTAEDLIEKNNAQSATTKVSYPPTTGELAPYFVAGEHIRTAVDISSSHTAKVRQTQLRKAAQILAREHDWTHNALPVDPAWESVKFDDQAFPSTGGCPAGSAVPFGNATDVCIGPKVVYWQGKVGVLTLLVAASAAAHYTAANGSTTALDQALAKKREAVELFRLCDANQSKGYLDGKFCRDGGSTAARVIPSETCVNRN